MSGLILEAAETAKSRYGTRIYLERGSHHILAQQENLAAASARQPSQMAIERKLAGYALADRIVVPSGHVRDSFRRDPVAQAKLFENPYGVDLAMFPTAPVPANIEPTVLFVGSWIRRTGVVTPRSLSAT